MDTTTVLIGALGVAAALALLVVFRLRQAGGESARRSELAELSGRLAQLTESFEGRLAELTKQVGENLGRSTTETLKTVGDVKARLAVIDTAQKNLLELSRQVVSLQQILDNKQARGAFGEIQLQDLVQNVLPPSAYQFQATLGGGQRADCLLKLPNPPGAIAIDAKFPLESYRALREAADDAARTAAARAFRTALTKHINDVADKYIVPGETAESALLFLPSEAVYAELHANFAEVVERSYRAKVWIVSPTTLMATLNTVRAVLKDARMREQAGIIQAQLLGLLDDVERLDKRAANLQKHFAQAGEDVRQIRISTEKVTKKAERIGELQLEESKEEAAEQAPRLISRDGDLIGE